MTDKTGDRGFGAKTSWLRLLVVNLCVLLVILATVEGLSSYVMFGYRLMTTAAPVAEGLHSEYDPELGWVNRKNVRLPDRFGRGISLRTNSQRFRSRYDYTPSVPPGTTRVVCSGDSFTLGYGVDDSHAWCGLLSSIDPSIETINMGQGGYGVDQMYLWYKRDGLQFQHQIHVFAVIADDFHRMQADSLAGYGKPVLEVENGALVVRNVPVPRRTALSQWLVDFRVRAGQLKSVELAIVLLDRLGMRAQRASRATQDVRDQRTRQVVEKILEDLTVRHRAERRELFVVYLPTQRELTDGEAVSWLHFVKATAEVMEIPFIDVVASFRALSPDEATEMFIPKGPLAYPGAPGHLSNQGNRRVAEVVYQALRKRAHDSR